MFLGFTLLFNVPLAIIAIITAIMAFVNGKTEGDSCTMFIHPGGWLLIAAALAVFFCCYAYRVFMLLAKQAQPSDVEAGYAMCGPMQRQCSAPPPLPLQ